MFINCQSAFKTSLLKIPPNRFCLFFLNLFIILFIFSCGSSINDLDGIWEGKTVKVSIFIKEKTFIFENTPDPTQSFSEKIISVTDIIGDKIEIQLTNDRKVTLKTFGGNTMFVYLEDGYLRLKKNNG